MSVCLQPGCPTIVPRGRCPQHALEQEHQRPNLDIRRLYRTARWRRLKTTVLQETPFCPCGRLGSELDHVVPHRGDLQLFWSKDNVQMLCTSCHSAKTARGE
jgi:5-methylcytosine-specific restriction protein A